MRFEFALRNWDLWNLHVFFLVSFFFLHLHKAYVCVMIWFVLETHYHILRLEHFLFGWCNKRRIAAFSNTTTWNRESVLSRVAHWIKGWVWLHVTCVQMHNQSILAWQGWWHTKPKSAEKHCFIAPFSLFIAVNQEEVVEKGHPSTEKWLLMVACNKMFPFFPP